MVGGLVGYSMYIDTRGLLISGTIFSKNEQIWVKHDSWSRRLNVTSVYQPAGELSPSYDTTAVDVATFDSLHVGSPVMVRYLPSRQLRQFILIPSSRLASRHTFSLFVDHAQTIRRVVAVLLGLAALIYLWRKAEMALAGWLLIPYAGALFLYIAIPTAPLAPAGSVKAGQATVHYVTHITRLLSGRHRSSIETLQPFEIVDLEFVPAGWRDPVHAVDEVDSGSISGLKQGVAVPILYQTDNPRIARIQAGARTFGEKAILTLLLDAAALVLVLLIVSGIGMVLSRLGKLLLQKAVEGATARRRRDAF